MVGSLFACHHNAKGCGHKSVLHYRIWRIANNNLYSNRQLTQIADKILNKDQMRAFAEDKLGMILARHSSLQNAGLAHHSVL